MHWRQITAATLAARFAAPLPVWTGAVAAMAPLGVLSIIETLTGGELRP